MLTTQLEVYSFEFFLRKAGRQFLKFVRQLSNLPAMLYIFLTFGELIIKMTIKIEFGKRNKFI